MPRSAFLLAATALLAAGCSRSNSTAENEGAVAANAAAPAQQKTIDLLSPASGNPIVAPSLDMVLGCYYMTDLDARGRGAYRAAENGHATEGLYSSFDEARLAFDLGNLDLRAPIRVRTERPVAVNGQTEYAEPDQDGKLKPRIIETTVGRIIFNGVLP